MSARFDEIYGEVGANRFRPSACYGRLQLGKHTVRSERMLMEQLAYNLLFRCGLWTSANEPVWHHTVLGKNGIAYWTALWLRSSLRSSCSRLARRNCFRMNTSPWTAR